MNLLKETLSFLKDNGKDEKDVIWCGSTEYGSFNFDLFRKIADIEYYNGFGGQEIARDLVIVGTDWWLEREEYDGSENWSFKTMPKKPQEKTITTLCNGDSWATLEEMNKPGGKYGDR